ncbi:MAG: 30S ribosomal protein S21 [Microgenomates group bacterium]
MATVVRKKPGDTIDSLIANFRRKVLADNILLELKKREFYKPPSVQRKERLAALKRKRR